MRIHAPVPAGSGARVLHDTLGEGIEGYRVVPYSAWWTLAPPLLSLFSSGKADLVHTAADYGLFFRRRGMPLVVTLHNYVCDSFMRPYSSLLQYLHYRSDLRWFTRRTLLVADRVVAISRFVMHRVREDLGISVPMRLIYNGVDEQRFVPPVRGRGKHGPVRVLFCGNLIPRKRPHLLVPLANALGRDFEIHYTAGLAAQGGLMDRPAAGAARLVNLGNLRHADMPTVYQNVDLLFMPSVREGFGLCVAEAMACGLPVVAANASALPELVTDGDGGCLCPVDDLGAYVRAIRTLADSTQERARMGQFNRARVEAEFTLARMTMEYRQLFDETRSSTVAWR
jgi:glycosyltransferase involved in cell wall biosynthesis